MRVKLDSVVNDADLAERNPFREQPVGRRATVRDDPMGTRVRGSLAGDLRDRPAGIHFAAIADADRHARKGGGRQAEDVRRQVARVNHDDAVVTAPAAECVPAAAASR